MKKIITLPGLITAISVFTILFSGCDKEGEKAGLDASKLSSICDSKNTLSKTASANSKSAAVSSESISPYTVSLLTNRSNNDGTFTWIWAVSNPNPGNGKNGTTQDLSHWGLSLGSCSTIANVVSAATSTDGVNWTYFEPSYKVDKSQSCYSSPVLKFDVGTVGTAKRYYKLVVNKNFKTEKTDALYKSGNATGCGVFKVCAIGCLVKD